MKTFFLFACLVLVGFITTANAQFFTSETTRKAGEKMQQGDRPGAIAVLDKAIEQRKDLLEAYQLRANLRSMSGDLDGAISDYSAALEINPNNAKIYERRAQFRLFKRDSAGALKDYDAAITNGLKTERVYTGRAEIKRDIGDIEGAITDYKTALTVNPSFASAHNGLAFILEKNGDLDGAIAHMEEFLNSYESSRDGKLPKIKGEPPTGTGVLIKREGTEKDGSQIFMTSENFAAPFIANSQEELDKHEARLNQLSNLVAAYATLGRMYVKKNAFERASETYEKALKIRKGDFYIHKLRSDLRIKRGDLPGAIEDLTIVANSQMNTPDIHADKGLLLILQGKDAEAEKEFALHLQRFLTAKESLDKRIEEAKKLRAPQTQQ